MASTKLIKNQFDRDYSGLREDVAAYKTAMDEAMDAIDKANIAINASHNYQLHRELLHVKFCLSDLKDREIEK